MTNTPQTPEKGHKGGECNRTACTNRPATWYNRYTQMWYCEDCATKINRLANPNKVCMRF